jgi:translation initiation factor 2 beta subunit (eIF-2beta)/eIF-5
MTEQLEHLNLNFNDMLETVYKQIEDKQSENIKLIIPNPVIEKSTTNTYWKNIKKILIAINRPPEHFVEFLNKEINTGEWASASKSDGLVLIGKFTIAQLQHVLQNYVKKYVVCGICYSTETILEKNKEYRSYFVNCNKCKSTYAVN